MPVIVVGADTSVGAEILERLIEPGREVRAFVSDPNVAVTLKGRGVKVALGDVSDESHVEAACLGCFSAVIISAAASDGRERSFADSSDDVMKGWADAVSTAGVHRVIWVGDDPVPTMTVDEFARVAPDESGVSEKVADLDDAQTISTNPAI